MDVVVRTKNVGHFFPGGTVDAYDTWLELKGTDDKGQTIFWSGMVEDNGKGPVEKGAHFYRSLQVDAHGNRINKRNAWATRAVVYVHLIPPGAADTVHYRMQIPAKLGRQNYVARAPLLSQVRVVEHAVLVCRRCRQSGQPGSDVTPDYDDRKFAFAGSSDGSVGKRGKDSRPSHRGAGRRRSHPKRRAAQRPVARSPKLFCRQHDWQRWNDYGIGLLLQGDLKAAQAAFEKGDRGRLPIILMAG